MTTSKKIYSAIHTTFYTVYKYGYALGSAYRMPEISFPEKEQADAWIDEHEDDPDYSWCKLRVEEMPCTIKAWDGKIPD